jgi:hypothetical protein
MTDDQSHSHRQIVTHSPWARSSVGDQPYATLEALQKGLTIALIATARVSLETCTSDDMLPSVMASPRYNDFDFLPVIEPKTSRIVGLIEIAPYRQGGAPVARVDSMMTHLSEDNLLGADASILMFVRNADHQKCRLIISEHEISGLVSLSDLQRLPVRASIFGLITYLEIIMTRVIRCVFKGSEKWLDSLSEGRRQKLQDEIKLAREKNAFVEALLFTQFADKATILHRSERRKVRGADFKSEFRMIQTLRDHLAHANDYAASPEAAVVTCETVRLIDQWNEVVPVV